MVSSQVEILRPTPAYRDPFLSGEMKSWEPKDIIDTFVISILGMLDTISIIQPTKAQCALDRSPIVIP